MEKMILNIYPISDHHEQKYTDSLQQLEILKG